MTTLALALFSGSALFLGALFFVGLCLHWRDRDLDREVDTKPRNNVEWPR